MPSETPPEHLFDNFAARDECLYFAYDLSDGKFIYLNPAFKSFFKIQGEKVSMKVLYAMIHPEDKVYLKQIYRAIKPGEFKNGIEFRIEFEHYIYCFSLSMFCQHQQNNKSVLLGRMENITAFKNYSDKLNEYSNKKNAVLNILSHDLAGPLGSIQNLSALLVRKKKLAEDKEVHKWLSLIESISKKSIQMIQDFVKEEFIESAGVAMIKKRTDFSVPLKTMVDEYQQSEKEMEIEFRLVYAGEPVFIAVDEAKFFQAINNLVSNAIKFTPKGGTISIGIEEKEHNVLITVADTGIGIPRRFHSGLFDKFNGARRTGLKGEPSVGLGMSIIKTIIDWHEGKIWFESEENKGTTFYIEIAKSV